MHISKTTWLSHNQNEAVISIQGRIHSIDCYVYGFESDLKDLNACILDAIDTKDVVLAEEENEAILMDGLSCMIVGILSNNRSAVKVDDFLININSNVVPKDICDGQKVCFRALRINLWIQS